VREGRGKEEGPAWAATSPPHRIPQPRADPGNCTVGRPLARLRGHSHADDARIRTVGCRRLWPPARRAARSATAAAAHAAAVPASRSASASCSLSSTASASRVRSADSARGSGGCAGLAAPRSAADRAHATLSRQSLRLVRTLCSARSRAARASADASEDGIGLAAASCAAASIAADVAANAAASRAARTAAASADLAASSAADVAAVAADNAATAASSVIRRSLLVAETAANDGGVAMAWPTSFVGLGLAVAEPCGSRDANDGGVAMAWWLGTRSSGFGSGPGWGSQGGPTHALLRVSATSSVRQQRARDDAGGERVG
jgi:hypothetical protein